MQKSPLDTYTLTIWLMGRPEKTWMELPGQEIARFEEEYAAYLQADRPRAIYVMEFEDRKRVIRLDMITDFSIVPHTDD